MKTCENCGIEHDGSYGSGRFCSTKCARGFSTKAKRKEINEKVSNTITGTGHGSVKLICKNCNNEFEVAWNKRNQQTCSFRCSAELKWQDSEYRTNIESKMQEIYSTKENRGRLRDIGRKGGFGTKGITSCGTRYESLIEKLCYEYLEDNNISFEAHKAIPNSSKVSDIYLTELDKWIEIDGINREAKKKWIGKDYDYWIDKLNHYRSEGLDYEVIYNVNELINITISHNENL
jgi:hypothetical protein